MASKTYRPEEIADKLGISGKVVRAYLRKTYKRPASAKGSTWVLTAKQANDTLSYFRKKNPHTVKATRKTRTPKIVATPTPDTRNDA